jgi:hypothetical protein
MEHEDPSIEQRNEGKIFVSIVINQIKSQFFFDLISPIKIRFSCKFN